MLNELIAFFVCLQTSADPEGAVPYGIGEPGVAKTKKTEAFARFIKFAYAKVIGSQRLPEDVLGAPKVVDKTNKDGQTEHVQIHAKPEWRFNLEQAEHGGMLHLDELGDCQPAMQAAMLEILEGGMANTWICATGNPIEISTNGYELSLPAINRLCQIEWPTDRASWKTGMMRGWEALDSDFPVLPADWRSRIPECKALVVNFTDRNASHFQQMPRDPNGEVKPWPSMRSWTHVATVLAAARSIGASEDVEDILIKGCVGEGAAIAFRQWIKSLDLPDPEELLADPEQFKPSTRGDLSFAVLCSVVAAVLRQNTPERWTAGWRVIEKQAEKAADIAASVCGPLARNKPRQNGKPMEIPDAIKERLFPVLNTAN
jgi:hypothetical protein